MQVDDAVLEILENDVAAIHRHRRAHPGLQQFLDLGDDLVVFLAIRRGIRRPRIGQDDRATRGEMFHDRGQNGRLQLMPVAVAILADGDEIGAEKHAGHLRQCEQPFGERRPCRHARIGKIGGARRHHGAAGQKFQRGRIRRLLGLNEHGGSTAD